MWTPASDSKARRGDLGAVTCTAPNRSDAVHMREPEQKPARALQVLAGRPDQQSLMGGHGLTATTIHASHMHCHSSI